VPAKDAFVTAIAIAQAQKTRSFELRARLSLAKLYRATGRDADAHAMLGPRAGRLCADAGVSGEF
jgi:hypothetical protein